MTKKLLFPYLFIFIVLGCNQNESQLTNAKDLYEQAILNNDATTAKMALNQIILLDTLDLQYQDSLSRIYMKSGNFEAGLKYAEIVYASGKADGQLKENMALAYQQIGETEKAEEFINSLLQTTKDYKYLFQKIVIQYENGNQPLFDSLSNEVLKLTDKDSLVAQTMVPMPGPVSGGNQLVPIKAATLFLIGNNALERKQDVSTAVRYLQKSIEEFEQFEMPRYVLMELEKMMSSRR
jgi:tetratricopeptide (TPR) repeat protein